MRLNILKDPKELDIRLPRRKLATLATIIGQREQVAEKGVVNLIMTGDARVRALNKQYRQLDRTTDVLSFTLEPDSRSSVIGEIYISVPRAREQALGLQHSLATEVLRLACHGLFHVIGYDHATDETAEEMEAHERSALAALDIEKTDSRS